MLRRSKLKLNDCEVQIINDLSSVVPVRLLLTRDTNSPEILTYIVTQGRVCDCL